MKVKLPRAIARGKFFQRPCKDLHEERKDLQESVDLASGLFIGQRLAGYEAQAEDILEALKRTQGKLDELAARYPNQLRRRSGHVPLLVPYLPTEPRPASGHGLLGESPQGHHPPMQKLACEMIRVAEDQDVRCGNDAAGITTDGVSVCFSCGQQMRSEGFLVVPLVKRRRELLFPFANVGDRFRFTYPEDPRMNCELTVEAVSGFQPNDLVVFSDGTECKQHVIGTLERIHD